MTKWTEYLNDDVHNRLANCRSTFGDIKHLVNAKWKWMKDTGRNERFTKEDALIEILELLDCNGQYFDLTDEQYYKLAK